MSMEKLIVSVCNDINSVEDLDSEYLKCLDKCTGLIEQYSINNFSYQCYLIETIVESASIDAKKLSLFLSFCASTQHHSWINDAILMCLPNLYKKLPASLFEELVKYFFVSSHPFCQAAVIGLFNVYQINNDTKICNILHLQLKNLKNTLSSVQIIDFLVSCSFDFYKISVGIVDNLDCPLWHKWLHVFSRIGGFPHEKILPFLEFASFKILCSEFLDWNQKAELFNTLKKCCNISKIKSVNLASVYVLLRSFSPDCMPLIPIDVQCNSSNSDCLSFSLELDESISTECREKCLRLSLKYDFLMLTDFLKACSILERLFIWVKCMIGQKTLKISHFQLESTSFSDVLLCLFECDLIYPSMLLDAKLISKGQSKEKIDKWVDLMHGCLLNRSWLFLNFLLEIFKISDDSRLFLKYLRKILSTEETPEQILLISEYLLFYAAEPRANVDEFLEISVLLFCKISTLKITKTHVYQQTALNLMKLFESLFFDFELIDYVSFSEIIFELGNCDFNSPNLLETEFFRIRCRLVGPIVDRSFKSSSLAALIQERNRLFLQCFSGEKYARFLSYFDWNETKSLLDENISPAASFKSLSDYSIAWLIDAEIRDRCASVSFLTQDPSVSALKNRVLDAIKTENLQIHDLVSFNALNGEISSDIDKLLGFQHSLLTWFQKIQLVELFYAKLTSIFDFYIKKLSKVTEFSTSSLFDLHWEKLNSIISTHSAYTSTKFTNSSILLGLHICLYQKYFAFGDDVLLKKAFSLFNDKHLSRDGDFLGFFLLAMCFLHPKASVKAAVCTFLNSVSPIVNDYFVKLCFGMLAERFCIPCEPNFFQYRYFYHFFLSKKYSALSFESTDHVLSELTFCKAICGMCPDLKGEDYWVSATCEIIRDCNSSDWSSIIAEKTFLFIKNIKKNCDYPIKKNLITWMCCEILLKISHSTQRYVQEADNICHFFKNPNDSWLCQVFFSCEKKLDPRFFNILFLIEAIPPVCFREGFFTGLHQEIVVDFCIKHIFKHHPTRKNYIFTSQSLKSILISHLISNPEHSRKIMIAFSKDQSLFLRGLEIIQEGCIEIIQSGDFLHLGLICEIVFESLSASYTLLKPNDFSQIWHFIEIVYLPYLENQFMHRFKTMNANKFLWDSAFTQFQIKLYAFEKLNRDSSTQSFEFYLIMQIFENTVVSVEDWQLLEKQSSPLFFSEFLLGENGLMMNLDSYFDFIIMKGQFSKKIFFSKLCIAVGINRDFIENHPKFFSAILDIICGKRQNIFEKLSSIKKILKIS